MTEVIEWRRIGHGQVWVDDVDTRGTADVQLGVTHRDPEVWSGVSGQVMAEDEVTEDFIEDLPGGLVRAYVSRAISHKVTREVDPGVWVASVAGLDGAYGDGDSPETACSDLAEAITGWVAVRRRMRLAIPAIEGLDLNLPYSHQT